MSKELSDFMKKLSNLCKEHNCEIVVGEKSKKISILDKQTNKEYPAIIR